MKTGCEILLLASGPDHVMAEVVPVVEAALPAEVTVVVVPAVGTACAFPPQWRLLPWPASDENDFPLDARSLLRFRQLAGELTLIVSSAEQVSRSDLYSLARPARRTVHLVHDPRTGSIHPCAGWRFCLRLLRTLSLQGADIACALLVFGLLELFVRMMQARTRR